MRWSGIRGGRTQSGGSGRHPTCNSCTGNDLGDLHSKSTSNLNANDFARSIGYPTSWSRKPNQHNEKNRAGCGASAFVAAAAGMVDGLHGRGLASWMSHMNDRGPRHISGGNVGEASSAVPVDGVAMTAIGVAVIRMRESRRPDRLYLDPVAQSFVDAAREGFSSDRWASLEQVADQFYEGRSVAVRLVDDRVRDAVGAGITQIVVLGAGLDTRAYRMDLPAEVTVFEVDLPELFAFKEPVLARQAIEPTCHRHVIAADLRGDWSTALCESGFEPETPTLWVDEGALAFIPPAARHDAVAVLSELSAPGSRFGVSQYSVDATSAPYTGLRNLMGSGDSEDAPRQSDAGQSDADVRAQLNRLGWDTEFESWNDAVARLDRTVPAADPSVGHIAAVRRGTVSFGAAR
ncbi:SAM-dependent methyltransferase [Mycolicibacterium setense]